MRKSDITWQDKKRHLGLPLSFTKYYIADGRLICNRGFWRSETDEILLYRILDIRLVRTFGQKLFGVGTVTLYSADRTDPTLELKNISNSDEVRTMLSKLVEKERAAKGIPEMFGLGHAGDTAGF